MSDGAFKKLKTGLIGLLVVALVFTMTFTSKVVAFDETQLEQINNVESLIDNIPSLKNMKLSDESKVKDARNAYKALDDELKGGVSEKKLSKLTASENEIKCLHAIDKYQVVKKIDRIPALSKLTWNSKRVKAAHNAFNRLSKSAKQCFNRHYKAKREKLRKAVAKQRRLKRLHTAKVEAAKVVKKIKKIPALSKLKFRHAKIIRKAKKAYKKLTKPQRNYLIKHYPGTYKKLKKSEKRMKTMKKQIRKLRKAKPVLRLTTSERVNIKVSWKKVKNADKYIVYRKTSRKFVKIKVTKERSFVDKKRFKSRKNIYKVRAVGWIGGKKVQSKYSKSKNKVLLKKSVIVKATAYTGGGHCANGMAARVGRVAVDPRYIPLGTWLYVDGYGLCQACDTGGAVKGWFVDVYFNTGSQCSRWGVRHPRVWILK